ncbi:3,4-dihydroxy 2-butanone 4-phosphate synthase / GTP cyclohydrolase II [Actinokineospora alba]|uniref:GTP cyclohydrolase-2 n=1 Tax=Actinokineospora alba TaxID=504798 RepID=A0A1H0ND49_9PSEU|nr:3,4-dihydroxy 2-butanone 4-phosphate synthase/GTP cyclohydrolase II [Actinokineospora alba]SDH84442.1 3,4-dihydroxy 2-butanone 4-phosphate synthase / GTP cyclohydrolase II [Actinokineospora alba]SDO90704.1 3,4-dihydroxy 2-butanone 4-phosphate synthase / GTP cyclohydrolase II [Actinokineospora alba]
MTVRPEPAEGDAVDEAISREDVAESDLMTRRGKFRAVAFRDGHEHMALVYGTPTAHDNVLVRVHSECMTGDIFGAMRCECGDQLDAALDRIVSEGSGVFVYLRGHEGRGIGLLAKVRTHVLQDEQGLDTLDSATTLGFPIDTRDYRPAAKILKHLRVRSVRLMSNNPDKIRALEANGIAVVERVPLLAPATDHNVGYLTAKRDRLGHDLPQVDTFSSGYSYNRT